MAVASNKRVVYVGGLAEEVNEKVIQVLEALLEENQGPIESSEASPPLRQNNFSNTFMLVCDFKYVRKLSLLTIALFNM